MTQHAHGTFDVTMSPASSDGDGQDATLGRFTLDKQFHGDLEGTSRGQMLTAGTATQGSAGYVAIERVTGTLAGRSGSFSLQHTGLMTRDAPELTVIIVPDSGTDELTGIAGSLTIGDGHSYDLAYTLPEG
jgi:hypothetical protein